MTISLVLIFYLINFSFQIENDYSQLKQRTINLLSKSNTEKQALRVINDLIYNNVSFGNDTFLLDFFNMKNWSNGYRQSLEYLVEDIHNDKIVESVNKFLSKEREIINEFNLIIKENKKKDITRISPIFEWSQSDEQVKIRIKFSKNLESPSEKDILNFKVNCTRSQLEVQAYKEHDTYLVHYYRRLNLYEFIRPSTCKSYKEVDGVYIVNFDKNQYTLYWNFLNQPTDDHYNTFTWFDVFSKYDNKIRYTEFRETAMENLLISDLDDFMKDDAPLKRKRLRKINKALKYLENKDLSIKNYCLSPANREYCNMPDVTEWGYWLIEK